MAIDRKNATIGLDRSETKTMYGRTLYRVVALTDIVALNVFEGDRGGWCSDDAVVSDRVLWIASYATFWGGTFRGGTFWGGTFRGGDFRGGDFRGGTFEGGDFRGGTFRGGDFLGGTFWGGDFWGGDFRGGTFRGGTFRGGTTTEQQPLYLAGLRWDVTITDEHMTIGCQHHALSCWWKFTDLTISAMDPNALEFWQEHKAALVALCAATGREAGRSAAAAEAGEHREQQS